MTEYLVIAGRFLLVFLGIILLDHALKNGSSFWFLVGSALFAAGLALVPTG